MRATRFAILGVAILIAGCTAPGMDGTPRTSDGKTSTGDGIPGVSHGTLIRPGHAENMTDGYFIVADASASGFFPPGNVTFTWTITNRGADARRASPPGCRPERNPEIHLLNAAGEELQLRPTNQVVCMIATQLVPFPAGSNFTAQWTWDGTIYDGQQSKQASTGAYTVTAAFGADRYDGFGGVQVSLGVDVLEGNRGVG